MMTAGKRQTSSPKKRTKTKKRELPTVSTCFMQLAVMTWPTNKGNDHLNHAESNGYRVFSTSRSGFQ